MPTETGIDPSEWSSAELFLLAGVEDRVRDSCAPATELPERSYAGIECTPEGIQAIGYYLFDGRLRMREVYFARLAEYGVEEGTGDLCFGDEPGEGVDTPGNETFELRIGCYVDETGAANARMIFPSEVDGQNVYVGVVGADGGIQRLMEWLFPGHEPGATGCGWCIGGIWFLATHSDYQQ